MATLFGALAFLGALACWYGAWRSNESAPTASPGVTHGSSRDARIGAVGKVLVLDVILNVAKYGGEQRFAQGGEWARRFASCVAVALDRPVVRIDVPGFVVG